MQSIISHGVFVPGTVWQDKTDSVLAFGTGDGSVGSAFGFTFNGRKF